MLIDDVQQVLVPIYETLLNLKTYHVILFSKKENKMSQVALQYRSNNIPI